ncbi:MAG: cyclic nucleotide-binding domain-containing protein [Spirochaetaceae bacterium]|jgi:CRP-like cAMP-binding protein|nr:cyclic nucleotide-binding domain-containing protein [Spirochaetaceae bacterium]
MIEPSALQKYALFGGLKEEQVAHVISHMSEEYFETGALIASEGQGLDRIRFILDGRVRITRGDLEIAQLRTGDTFGEMEVLDIMPCAADIKAMEPSKCLALSNRNLHHIYKDDLLTFSMLIMNLARDLSRRLRRMNEIFVQESPVNEWS